MEGDERRRQAHEERVNRPRLVGINHVALEVPDIERALAFYGRLFDIKGVERETGSAFVDMGDQFIALFEPGSGDDRHFGLVVDDKEAARRALTAAEVDILPGHRLDFRDPFGNRVQVVQYDQIQFTKADRVLEGMGLALGKTEQAIAELRGNGLA
ncbi:MAG: VOC family protein [Actinobacteria bacterium]|nr:VOC family protein [Actinomycetota bacterium]